MAGDVDWGARAAVAELAVVRRYLRPIAGVLPGTRIGRVRWPRRGPSSPLHWHYGWQAHLLDCLVDAQLRDPQARRAGLIAAVTRGVRWRNGGRWMVRRRDELAWLGLAVQRAGGLARRAHGPALVATTEQLHRAWSEDGGGGIFCRGDGRRGGSKCAPLNGPAAILLARDGQVDFAAAIADWMCDTLVDPDSGLVRDGVRLGAGGVVRAVDARTSACSQGVLIGACIELAARDGHLRWGDRAVALVDAVTRRLARSDGVLPGCGGGDGGLFAGVLARYLGVAAVRRPELADAASRLVLASADAAWRGRAHVRGGPVFSAEWARPAMVPRTGVAEGDLSVQLSAWMLLEAAATVQTLLRRP